MSVAGRSEPDRVCDYLVWLVWWRKRENAEAEYLSWLPEHDKLMLTNPGELEYRSWA